MQRLPEDGRNQYFSHGRPEGRPGIDIAKASKICNTQITTSVYNSTTRIVANCTADGRVVFILMDNLENGSSADLSSIQLSEGSLYSFIWPTNHEFLVTDPSTGLILFNIINLRKTIVGNCCSTVQVLRQRDGIIFAGTEDGNINLYDSRAGFKEVGSALHVLRNIFHSVTDVAVSGNQIYSATTRKGRMWLWDLRNLKKKIRTKETERDIFSIVIPENTRSGIAFIGPSIYILSGGSVLRADPGLSLLETLNIKGSCRTLPSARLQHSAPHDLFLWNVEDGVCIWDGEEAKYQAYPEINGIESATHGKYILYTKDGHVTTSVITRRYTKI
ncbi:hypothetical protein PAEPH01_0474 [Pancytospora epiphaga]|nr:hypothetical protein PAEPH01_0474 [Pancytospora epiphaga]